MEFKLDYFTCDKCFEAIKLKHQHQKDKMMEYLQKLGEDPSNKDFEKMFCLFKARTEGLEIALETLRSLRSSTLE